MTAETPEAAQANPDTTAGWLVADRDQLAEQVAEKDRTDRATRHRWQVVEQSNYHTDMPVSSHRWRWWADVQAVRRQKRDARRPRVTGLFYAVRDGGTER